jgi:acyl-CoA reductase-like NAD-dependent aldehyde dehydrogenase
MSDINQSPRTYSGFETQPIGGRWRTGRSTRSLTDINPFNGKTLIEIPLASAQDVDEAYESAGAAQLAWAAASPSERALILHNAVRIFYARREEIISWLIQEAGSTRLKATIEWENASQLRGVIDRIEQAKREGARMMVGGEPDGQLLPPHVFTEVAPDSVLAREKSFGPIAPILRAKNEADALELASASDYELSSAVYCGDPERGVRFAQAVEAGITHVNDTSLVDEAHAAFVGEKNSGIGRFGGEWIIDEFTSSHWISVQHTPRAYPF